MRATRELILLLSAWLLFSMFVAVTFLYDPWFGDVITIIPNLIFIAAGTIIVRRTEQKSIGWLMVVIGVGFMVWLAAADASVEGATTWTQIGHTFSWLVVAMNVILVLIFPSGTFPRPSWTAVGGLAVVTGVAAVAATASSTLGNNLDTPTRVVIASFGVLIFVAFVLHLVEFRHRDPVERRQVAWFLLAVLISAVFYVVAIAMGLPTQDFLLADALATSLAPVAILIAITRYHLYEIDRIFTRTVTYAVVVVALGAVFALITWLPGFLIGGASDSGSATAPPVIVALSTLIVAALFNPLRRRVQAKVDRRFNRSRYEIQAVMDEFAAEIRESTHTDRVFDDFQRLVSDTMSPAAIGSWERSAS